MTEILTESFCERCGTRYTFESSAPRRSRIGRVRTLSRGVKNFVMSDEASFSEAMADARGEEELAATAHQLDAFHKTFNFCLTCRQYTCGDCWNPTDGRCLTCAPMEGRVEPAIAAATVPVAAGIATTNGHDMGQADDDLWPEADLSQDRLARALGAEAVVADDSIEDEAPSQLEVDAATQAFDAPEMEEAAQVVDVPASGAAAFDDSVDEAQRIVMDDVWLEAEPVAADEAMTVDAGAVHVVDVGATASAIDAAPEASSIAAIGDDGRTEAEAALEGAGLAAAGLTAGAAQEAAAFDAEASAAEQDATAEAVMDTALEFDLDEPVEQSVSGVAPGQSLEEAIAAYEARLAAEEREAAEAGAESAPVLADAVATESVVEEPAAEPEPGIADAAIAAAALSVVDEPEAVIGAMPASPEAAPSEAVVEPVVEPVVSEADDRDEHERALAAFAAAALAAQHDEPAAASIEDEFVTPETLAARFEPEPEPVAAEAEPEPVAAEPEPVAAEPEPVAAEPEPAAAERIAAEPEPEPVAAAADGTAGVDVVPQPTWPTTDAVAPATPSAPLPAQEPAPPAAAPWLMVAPEETTQPEPQWPSTPAWRAGARNTDAPTTLAGRTLLPQPDATALWAASAREVLSAPIADPAVSTAPQPCVQCGLSLSASARFCRRCGTRQA